MPNITKNINRVRARIEKSASNANRHSAKIDLLAVSKGQPTAALQIAYDYGLRRFGENYLQEALSKMTLLKPLQGIEWHFIGPLQSNKTRKAAENFDWVHTIDRLKIAQRLSEQRAPEMTPLNICLQVNVDKEANKSGFCCEELLDVATIIAHLPGLKLRGLMAIPKASNNHETQYESFSKLAAELKKLQHSGATLSTLDTLSMGMSADMEAAINAGATIVRVGSDIFGPRPANSPSSTLSLQH